MTVQKRMVCWRIGAVAVCAALMLGAALGPTVVAGESAIPPGTEVYEWHPELGGWLDTSTNLIWGYNPMAIDGSTWNYKSAVFTATNYAEFLTNHGFPLEAEVAAQYSNWRLPTLVECQDAYAMGFFGYGPDEFNWDQSPATGLQGLPYGGRYSWTSTPGTKKYSRRIMLFSAADGTTLVANTESTMDMLAVVRTHTPTP